MRTVDARISVPGIHQEPAKFAMALRVDRPVRGCRLQQQQPVLVAAVHDEVGHLAVLVHEDTEFRQAGLIEPRPLRVGIAGVQARARQG